MLASTFARLEYASSHSKYGSFVLTAALVLFIVSFPSVVFHLHNQTPLYPYLSPWLQATVFKVLTATSFPLPVLLWTFQSLIYFISVICLTKTISKVSRKIAVFSLFLLYLNFYFTPYLSITLPEAINTILFIFWMAAIISIHNKLCLHKKILQAYLFFPIAILFSALLIVLRPSNIWICIITVAILLYYLWSSYQLFKPKKMWFIGLLCLGALLIGSLVYLFPLLHQNYFQMLHIEKLAALPLDALGKAHLQESVVQMKYVSIFKDEDYLRYHYYINPLVNTQIESLQTLIIGYIKNPLDVLTTIVLKLVGAFNFDYITPHVYELKSWYRWPSVICAFSIIYLGLWGIFSYLKSKAKNLFFGPRFFPSSLSDWLRFHCTPTMYELHFGLPLLALLLVFSVERLLHMYNEMNPASLLNTFAIYIAAMFGMLLAMGWPYWTF